MGTAWLAPGQVLPNTGHSGPRSRFSVYFVMSKQICYIYIRILSLMHIIYSRHLCCGRGLTKPLQMFMQRDKY